MLDLKRKIMTVVSTKEFISENKKYLDMAVNGEVCIKDDKYMYHLIANPIEPDIIFQPDDDFYRSISADEFRKKALEIVEKVHNRYYSEK